MTEMCTRCLVQVQIQQITWPYNESRELSLKGPPLFLKVLLMGQAQSSLLFHPFFPVSLNYSMTFDRVFTNCKLPTLLPEMLRDDQFKIELIQLKSDYSGGKILARHESHSYTFLFPHVSKQVIELNKSSRYKHPPSVHITTSVSISDSIVQSPVSVLTSKGTGSVSRLNSAISSTQERLRSAVGQSDNESTTSPLKILKKVSFTEEAKAETGFGRNLRDQQLTSTPNNRQTSRLDVVSKYLLEDTPFPSNQPSPYQQVQNKVQRVLDQYWDVKVDTDELDISDSEDEDHIRNSFAAEREDSLNRSSQLLHVPQDSLLTRLGPVDYWSKQLSEYSGESHRQVFSETMEKIYNRLYHKSLHKQ